MADAIIQGAGGGGTGSDEVTATKAQVLSGYTAVTKDSDDEIGEGTMPYLSSKKNTTLTASDSRPVIVGAENWMVTNADGTVRYCIEGGKAGYDDGKTIFAIDRSTVAGKGDLTAAKLLKGQTAFGLSGTATSDATATAAKILSGYTAYVNGEKIPGAMTCNSILNFSAQAYSTTQILLQWQNPYAATGKPFSGVFINYSTSGYPGTGGTRIYTGSGSSTTAGGWSQAIVTMPSAGTTYYFSATAYAICSAGDMWGNTLHAVAATTAHGRAAFTSSGSWTVPAGVRTINVHCTGGGGGGNVNSVSGDYYAGGGGGGGYTAYKTGIGVTPGTSYTIEVGAGGAAKGNGGASSFKSGATAIVSANGGYGASDTMHEYAGASGGSGGGRGGDVDGSYAYWDPPTAGASNGGSSSGSGQGTTTKEFGTGTLYAGGGGGGGVYGYSSGSETDYEKPGADGGSGGGGRGGDPRGSGSNGSAGTGGGGGGCGYPGTTNSPGSGGSGNVIITW